MSLTDVLRQGKKYAKPIGSRDQFKDLFIDELLRSEELKSYFFDGDGRKGDDKAKYQYSELVRFVDEAYDKYGRKNFEEKGFLRTFVAKPLRSLGCAVAATSHYILTVYLSPETYAVTMAPALGMMTAADVIEGLSYLYHNHEGYDLMQIPKILMEGLLEKGLAIIPGYITPLAEATLGNTKFDRAVAGKILYKAKNEFVKKFGEYKVPEKKYLENIIEIPFQKDFCMEVN